MKILGYVLLTILVPLLLLWGALRFAYYWGMDRGID
jgi:hypothetical protein